MNNIQALADNYSRAFPDRPGLLASKDWLTGTWAIGACYKNPNKIYGAYPYGYLDRVHAIFPNATSVLHVFSGGMTKEAAEESAWQYSPCSAWQYATCGDTRRMELVDVCGPEQGRHPTWQGDVFDMPGSWRDSFDLILADPPYSAEDAAKYGTPMVNRGKVAHHLRQFCRIGGSLVWLDTVWPMHRKTEWRTYGHIGLVRSTNHRMRLVSIFEAV